MTDVKKIVTTAFATFVATVLGGIILFSFTSYGEGLEKKVDKTEFETRKTEVNKCLEKKVDEKVFEVSMQNIDIFIKNQLIIQNDIKEMLRDQK